MPHATVEDATVEDATVEDPAVGDATVEDATAEDAAGGDATVEERPFKGRDNAYLDYAGFSPSSRCGRKSRHFCISAAAARGIRYRQLSAPSARFRYF